MFSIKVKNRIRTIGEISIEPKLVGNLLLMGFNMNPEIFEIVSIIENIILLLVLKILRAISQLMITSARTIHIVKPITDFINNKNGIAIISMKNSS